MYILRVAPLTTIPLPHEQVLDYFGSAELPAGALVEVMLNRRTVPGVVLAATPLKQAKAAVRKSVRYTLRNITRIISENSAITPQQLELARWVAKYYWAPFGHALKLVLPQPFVRRPITPAGIPPARARTAPAPQLVWKGERTADYVQGIPTALRAGQQVLLLVPDRAASGFWQEELSRAGVPCAAYAAERAPQALRVFWSRVAAGEPLVVVGTRRAAFLPFVNLGLVIVDDEESSAYKSWDQSPRYDTREVAEKLAELHGAQLVFGSIAPTVTSFLRLKRGRLAMRGPDRAAQQTFAPTVVDLRGERQTFSGVLKDATLRALGEERPVVLFVNRRGTAPVVLCRECGAVLECPHCSASMVQHRGAVKGTNVLVCHHCDTRLPVPDTCPTCRSHELRAVGVGTERIEQEATSLWPNARVARLDSDIAATSREVEKIAAAFSAGNVDVLVTTQLGLALRHRPFPKPVLLGIVALEPLLAFPDYGVTERLWQFLHLFAPKISKLIIQAYLPDSPFLEALGGSPEAFYASELAERRALRFPPFSELIKLTFRHRDSRKAEIESAALAKRLAAVIAKAKASERVTLLGPAPAFIAKERGQYVWNLIIQSRLTSLKARNTLLSFVPSNWIVDVHPESIL